jgi:UDP-2,4-diacetamido-2,4,6-trideoxy-beta-L-altropyranose hydrolase
MAAASLFGHVCLRADAGAAAGTGHLMRCLALAEAWQDRGGTASFVTATAVPALLQRLGSEGFAAHRLQAEPASAADAAESLVAASSSDATWIVVDGYPFGPGYLKALRDSGLQLLVVDDLAAQDLASAHLIVNPNVQATPELYAGTTGRVLAGSAFALLRREFQAGDAGLGRAAVRPGSNPANRVVITMGGSDPPNATGRILEILSGYHDRRLKLTVILGPANPHLKKLEVAASALRRTHAVELLVDPPDLPAVLSRAELAITAAGTGCWELASLGVPLALVVVADNQRAGAAALAAQDLAVLLGWHGELDDSAVLQQLAPLLNNSELRRRMSADARALIDGRGACRVAERMAAYPLQLRSATVADAHLLYEWANDPLTRRMSFSSEPIPWGIHVEWLARRLADPDCRLFVAANQDGLAVGQVRLDRDGPGATLSFSLAPAARGQGLAARLVRLAAVDSLMAGWCQAVDAWVRLENIPSAAAFRRAGFTEREAPPELNEPRWSQGGALLFSLS